jgi:acetyl-CoA carboxylase carboxyltransferase component
VRRRNGTIERFADSEDAAFALARRFLSYLPGSVHELPPVQACADPADRREEALASVIPRSPRLPYRLAPILDAVFDRGSVLRYAEYGGATVTALARLDGHPVGVIATDPYKGATMSVDGQASALARCPHFHHYGRLPHRQRKGSPVIMEPGHGRGRRAGGRRGTAG